MTTPYILIIDGIASELRHFQDIAQARDYFKKKYLIEDKDKQHYQLAKVDTFHTIDKPTRK